MQAEGQGQAGLWMDKGGEHSWEHVRASHNGSTQLQTTSTNKHSAKALDATRSCAARSAPADSRPARRAAGRHPWPLIETSKSHRTQRDLKGVARLRPCHQIAAAKHAQVLSSRAKTVCRTFMYHGLSSSFDMTCFDMNDLLIFFLALRPRQIRRP